MKIPTHATLSMVACIACLVTFRVTPAAAGQKTTLGQRYPAAQRVPLESVDHTAWDALLRKYVDANGYVNYAAWHANPRDLAALDTYIHSLSRGNASSPGQPAGKIAFWINAYNAVTIRGILNEYPTSSIRNHTAKIVGYNIWHDLLLQVGEQAYSLDMIEHKVLRPTGESRIHFAIVCASVSCPRLRNEAYTAQLLESQLSDNTRDFFSRSQNFSVRGKTAQVSSILKWFTEDFGATPQAGLTALAGYLPVAGQQLVATDNFRVSYLSYDWGLNDQKSLRSAAR